jgi:Mg/Co/Ni transporter MgtE
MKTKNPLLVPELREMLEVAPDKETIYYAYVVDEHRKLLGFVSLKDLILARRDARVGDIMHRDVIFARAEDDQEEAARKIQKYDLIALPVLNGKDALVGIITHDDAIDIITQEHTEDMEKFMAIALALGLQVVTSTLIGALLPLAAARAKLDPAVVASPALTTIVDIPGLLIFFTTTKWMLGI